MIKDVARGDAEVILVRRCKVLEVTALLVDKLEANLRYRVPARDLELVAPILEAQPHGTCAAVFECARRDKRALLECHTTVARAIPHFKACALPAVASRIIKP